MITLGGPWVFYGKVNFAFWSFIWEESIDFIVDFGAKVSKYS